MNARQKQAAFHARELRMAKDNLIEKVNMQIQAAQQKGYHAEVTPQLSRLLNATTYRQRDVVKINQLANNAEKLKDYIFVVDPETGVPISGEETLARYSEYQKSGIYKPPIHEEEKMIDSVVEAIEDSFVDDTALNSFRSLLREIVSNPTTAISEDWWQLAHPSWYGQNYRGDVLFAKEQMVHQNSSNVYEIRDALEHLIATEGIKSVAKRITENFETLQDATIMAAIGYNNVAASALQQALIILLPSDRQPGNIRHRISDMQEVIEGQFEDYGE